jgi:hypothetical protein
MLFVAHERKISFECCRPMFRNRYRQFEFISPPASPVSTDSPPEWRNSPRVPLICVTRGTGENDFAAFPYLSAEMGTFVEFLSAPL